MPALTSFPICLVRDARGCDTKKARHVKDKLCPNQTVDRQGQVDPKILEQWTKKERAFWVDPPGKNGFFLQDIWRKYTVQVEDTYNPMYKPKAKVFIRSFNYEFDCMENARIEKVRQKVLQEKNFMDKNELEGFKSETQEFLKYRWQEEPNYLEPAKADYCRRRNNMAEVGIPFRSEACRWYYERYPPPNVRIKIDFSK